jgi:Do/DeqQ family serine protease
MRFDWKITLIGLGSAFGGGIVAAVLVYSLNQTPEKNTYHNTGVLYNPYPIQFANHTNTDSNLQPNNQDFAQAAALATPSVVFIKTTANVQRQPVDDFWSYWDFYGFQRGPIHSAGSGVIISADGYIATNNHVVDKADVIEVILKDKHNYRARVVGTDPNTDLAILKIEATNLKPIIFANSDFVRIGDWSLAIGNPMNLTYTVTAGIISARGRNINIVNSQFPIESFLQTDAAINPGNSGGALVNIRGELIGINTAIASKTGAYSGYGFAIPSNIVRKIADDLIKYGEVQRVFPGCEVVDLDGESAEKLGVKASGDLSGVYVVEVLSDGAAEKAGLKEGDVILKIDETAINTKPEYLERLSYYRPGDKVKISYRRGSQIREATLHLTNQDGTTEVLKKRSISSEKLGAVFVPLSKIEKQQLGISSGFRITELKNGILRRMGLPENFIIISINRVVPNSIEEIEGLLTNTRGRVIIDGIHPNGGRMTYQFMSY